MKLKTVTIELDGRYRQTITLDIPNGKFNNYAEIEGGVKLKNIKNESLVNKGSIQDLDIYDENGCKIENESSGEIWFVTIVEEANDVYIVNSGDITKYQIILLVL